VVLDYSDKKRSLAELAISSSQGAAVGMSGDTFTRQILLTLLYGTFYRFFEANSFVGVDRRNRYRLFAILASDFKDIHDSLISVGPLDHFETS
jgi:hypothetical protein